MSFIFSMSMFYLSFFPLWVSVLFIDVKNIIERLKKKDSIKKIINLGEIALILIIFLLVTSSLIDNSYNPFLYFRF